MLEVPCTPFGVFGIKEEIGNFSHNFYTEG